jgi:3-hydroxybutyryl-CoA dehydratase
MNCKTVDEINVGDKATLTRTFSEADVFAYAGVSQDVNPVHVDPHFAKNTIFKQRVAHGMFTASMISAVLANDLPGVGTIYLSQTLKFTAPVFLGDTLTAEVEVAQVDREKGRVVFNATLKNQRGEVVLTGESKVLAPRSKPM